MLSSVVAGVMGLRAEQPPAGVSEVPQRHEERGSAIEARSLGRTFSATPADYMQFIVTDDGPMPSSISEDIATLARGDDVGGVVVADIPVDMIGHDRLPTSATPDPPERLAAPMARVIAGADPFVQNKAVLLNLSITASQEMIRQPDLGVRHDVSVPVNRLAVEGR